MNRSDFIAMVVKVGMENGFSEIESKKIAEELTYNIESKVKSYETN